MLMKKLISTLAAVALMFTMAIPVAAAESPSPSGGGSGDVVTANTTDGFHVQITDAGDMTESQVTSLQEIAAEVGGSVEYSVNAVNLEVVDDAGNNANDRYFAMNSSLLVSFVRDSAAEVLAVLYWNSATQTWDRAAFTQDGTSVWATLNHLCTVVFIVKSADDTAAAGTAGSGTTVLPDGTTTTTGSVDSAQTGYTAFVWAILAVAALAGAGICLQASKKSAVSAA